MTDEIDDRPDAGPSRTALKRADHELRELAVALTDLPRDRLAVLDPPSELVEALDQYRSTRSHGARKRQGKYLGRIMRGLDPEPYREAVEAFRAGHRADAAAFHRIEDLRDDLVAGDEAVTRYIDAHPDVDVQRLRQLVRNARKEQAQATDAPPGQPGRHGKAWRELFRLLRDAGD